MGFLGKIFGRKRQEDAQAATTEVQKLWQQVAGDVKAHRDLAYLWFHRNDLDKIKQGVEALKSSLASSPANAPGQQAVMENLQGIAAGRSKEDTKKLCEELIALLSSVTAQEDWFRRVDKDILYIISELTSTSPKYPLSFSKTSFQLAIEELKKRGLPKDASQEVMTFLAHHIEELRKMDAQQFSGVMWLSGFTMQFKNREVPVLNEYTWPCIKEMAAAAGGESIKQGMAFKEFCTIQGAVLDDEGIVYLAILLKKSKDHLVDFFRIMSDFNIPERMGSTGYSPEAKRMLFAKLLKYFAASGSGFEHRMKSSVYLYLEFIDAEKSKGKSAEQIDIKEFSRFVSDLDKKKIIGPLAKGDLVMIPADRNDRIYNIASITGEGYFVQPATLEHVKGVVKGPYRYAQLKIFEEGDDWTRIEKLREKGFLVIHATNAYGVFTPSMETMVTNAFANIERDVVSGKKYTISCSSISPLYAGKVCLGKGDNYALGDVLSEGKIYAAYPHDAYSTSETHPTYRTSLADKVLVRLAITSSSLWNELLPQDWKMDGVFYLARDTVWPRAPPQVGTTKRGLPFFEQFGERMVERIEDIAIRNNLKVFVINNVSGTWTAYRYDRHAGKFMLDEVEAARARAA